MKLWIDDVREPPKGYYWIKSVNEAKAFIINAEFCQALNEFSEKYNPLINDDGINHAIELISIDHDAGDYACYGDDYIKLLEWLEATGRNYPIHIHSMNVVGVQNMRAIIQHNNWQEVYHI